MMTKLIQRRAAKRDRRPDERDATPGVRAAPVAERPRRATGPRAPSPHIESAEATRAASALSLARPVSAGAHPPGPARPLAGHRPRAVQAGADGRVHLRLPHQRQPQHRPVGQRRRHPHGPPRLRAAHPGGGGARARRLRHRVGPRRPSRRRSGRVSAPGRPRSSRPWTCSVGPSPGRPARPCSPTSTSHGADRGGRPGPRLDRRPRTGDRQPPSTPTLEPHTSRASTAPGSPSRRPWRRCSTDCGITDTPSVVATMLAAGIQVPIAAGRLAAGPPGRPRRDDRAIPTTWCGRPCASPRRRG